MQEAPAKPFYTVREAAALLGIERATLQQRLTRGTVGAVKGDIMDARGEIVGWQWLIPAEELDRVRHARQG